MTKTTDYIGGTQYEGGTLLMKQTATGRLRIAGNAVVYEYTLKDHSRRFGVGALKQSNRVTFGDSNADGIADLLQEDHYYPFGLKMSDGTQTASPLNAYRYNGKEYQDELGLAWYDYGARMYDPSIARWNGVDALAEKYAALSPYNYVLGNPLRFVDPDGMQVDDYKLLKNGKLELVKRTEDKFDQITSEDGSSTIQVSKISSITEGESGQILWFNNAESGDKYYKFAGDNTDVEFAKIEGKYPNKEYREATVGTSFEEKTVGNEPSMVNSLSKEGFVADLVSHTHPGGNNVPSGYYGEAPNNPLSLTPKPSSELGDAQNARSTSKLPGFNGAKFEIYCPDTKTITTYDGVNKALIKKL